jgi:hypothetical protein
LLLAESAATRASTFAFGFGAILSVTQIFAPVIFATASHEVLFAEFSGSAKL